MLILITVGLQIQPSKGRLRNNRIAVITLKRAVCEYPTSVLMKSRCTISGEKNESNESNEKNGKSDWSVSYVVSLRQKYSCFASDWRSSEKVKMTDDGYDSKNKKNLPAYVRTYVRRKVFYTLSVISVIRHPRSVGFVIRRHRV